MVLLIARPSIKAAGAHAMKRKNRGNDLRKLLCVSALGVLTRRDEAVRQRRRY
jgi:hypothetical protein